MVGFRKTLFCEEISENASHIITNSRRKGTLSNDESAWRKWASWCLEQKVDPFQTPVKDIIEYLTFLFNCGNGYKTIDLHRSAVSAFHENIDGLLVGKDPRISSLVYGVFNLRPPKLRYMFVWDVKQVLAFLKEKFGDNDQLSNKELTLKVTIILDLTSSSRISALHILDLNHMIKTNEYYEFRFHKLHKSWRRGESPSSLKIYAIPSDKPLYVVAALEWYIERTSIWREKNQASQLLVSFIKPHNAAAKSTVAGWVKQILIMSGINIDIFKPHSTRSASSSHARLSGLSLSDILERGSWSDKTTWEKFYDKPILTFEEKFQKAVVN